MASNQYEIEIKTLLGEGARAEKLRNDLKAIDPSCTLVSTSTQLNHYFVLGDLEKITRVLAAHLTEEVKEKLAHVAREGSKVSIRTREESGAVFFVLKASIGDDSSANGVARMEIQEPIKDLSLAELDQLLLDAGCTYQAKWSRAREEYKTGNISMCLDKNAGYGYVAEFEKVVDDVVKADAAKAELRSFMEQLGVVELPQDRLERMFAFYNAHWPEYYGTDNVFVIE